MPTMVIVAGLVRIGDRGAEEDLVVVALQRGVDDFGLVEPAREKADAAIDLAQPLLAIEIVPVLGAVAVGGGPGDDLHHLGTVHVDQVHQLVAQAVVARGGNVVLGAGRHRRGALGQVVVIIVRRLFDKSLVHGPDHFFG
jgi:hypothetical protein